MVDSSTLEMNKKTVISDEVENKVDKKKGNMPLIQISLIVISLIVVAALVFIVTPSFSGSVSGAWKYDKTNSLVSWEGPSTGPVSDYSENGYQIHGIKIDSSKNMFTIGENNIEGLVIYGVTKPFGSTGYTQILFVRDLSPKGGSFKFDESPSNYKELLIQN